MRPGSAEEHDGCKAADQRDGDEPQQKPSRLKPHGEAEDAERYQHDHDEPRVDAQLHQEGGAGALAGRDAFLVAAVDHERRSSKVERRGYGVHEERAEHQPEPHLEVDLRVDRMEAGLEAEALRRVLSKLRRDGQQKQVRRSLPHRVQEFLQLVPAHEDHGQHDHDDQSGDYQAYVAVFLHTAIIASRGSGRPASRSRSGAVTMRLSARNPPCGPSPAPLRA